MGSIEFLLIHLVCLKCKEVRREPNCVGCEVRRIRAMAQRSMQRVRLAPRMCQASFT